MPDLTPMQTACWINGHAAAGDAQTPSAHLYVELETRDATPPLDPTRLSEAFAALIARHPNLRLSVSTEGRATIVPPGSAHALRQHDLRGLDARAVEAALARLRADKTDQRLPLAAGQPFEGTLSLLPGGGHRLHLDLDMVAADPSCLPDLLDDLAQLYEDGPGDAAPAPGPDRVDRSDDTQARAQAREWWRDRLSALPEPPCLPAVDPAPNGRCACSTRLAATLDPAQARGFIAQARALRVTPSALALAVFAQELGRACGQTALRLTVPIFHRDDADPVIGDASNFTLLGIEGLQEDLPALAQRVQTGLVQGISQSAYPGPQLLRDLARQSGRMPEAPVVFTAGLDHPRGSILGERARRVLGDLVWSVSQGPGVALDAQIARLGTGILVNWDIRLDLLDRAWTEALFTRVLERLRALAQAPVPPRSWPLAPLQRAYLMGRETVLPLGGVAMQEARLFRGVLDPETLRARLSQLVAAHPALRLRVEASTGRQHCLPQIELPWTVLDLTQPPDAATRLDAFWEDFAHAPCPLDGALWQVVAVQMPAGQADALAVKFDALALDGPAIAQICAEMLATAPPEIEPAMEPARSAPMDPAQRQSDAAYWAEALAGIEEPPRLPWRMPLQQLGPARRRRSARRIAAPQVETLRRIAAREKLFLNSLLSFTVLEVLARFTPNLRLCVGLPTAPALDRTALGNRASFIVIDHAVGPDPACARAAALQSQTMQALAHSSLSGVDLVRQLLARTGAALALPVVLTNELNWPLSDPSAPLHEVARLTQTPQVALDLRLLWAAKGGIEIAADYAENALAPETVAAMLDAIAAALAAICAAGELVLPDPLVPVALPAQSAEIPDPVPHLPRLAAQLRAGQGTALIFGERRLSYAALRRHVEELLDGLAARGIGPGDVVAIELPRSPEHVALQLATAMAGVIRVPIDAAAPPARRDQLLARCAPALVVSHRAIDGFATVTPEALNRPGGTLPDDATLTARSLSRDPGYYLFTSGSTGTPKCVVLNNRATANVLAQSLQAWQMTGTDVLISVTPLHHDMSVFDVFGTLCAGATLVLPEQEKDAMDWARLVAQHGVTLWVSVPAILEMLLACARPDQLTGLRLVAQGGDYIKPAVIARLRKELPGARLVSLGGPTETTIWSIWHEIETAPENETGAIPYGRALAGAEYRICNPLGEPCPPGVPGRIHTLGDCLALGYLKDGRLAQTDFVPLSAGGATDPPRRAFRTGDLGSWRADGVILFSGRLGSHIKVRGVRVSLTEIEAALACHPGVRAAIVVDLASGDGRETTLAAVYACRDNVETGPGALRAFLRETLPPSHLPDRFVQVPKLPLSANGKPDRAAVRRLASATPTAPPAAPVVEKQAEPALVAQVLALYLERLRARNGAAATAGATADSPLLDLGLLPDDLAPMAAALNARFGTALTPAQLLAPRNARAVAALIDAARPWHALTLAQLDFWEEFGFHPDRPLSTVAHCTVIEGNLDEAALIGALRQLAQEAEVLALRFRDGPEGPQQQIDPARIPVLRYHDLRYESDPGATARKMMERDIAAPIDLRHDPLAALWLLRVGTERWLWYLRGHHILLDGYSVALIERRAAALYAQARGKEADPGPLRPFAQYLEEEECYRASSQHARDGAWWAQHLAGGPKLAVLRKGAEDYGCSPLAAEPALPADLSSALARAAATADLGWPDLLTLLCAAWLARDLPEDGPGRTIWLPYMSRLGSVSATIPALVVNILPLVVTRQTDETLGAWLRRSAATLRQLRRHGRYRVEQIAQDHGLGKGKRFFFSPLINLLPFDSPRFVGCRARREVLAAGPGDGFNMTFAAAADGTGLTLSIDADPASARNFDAACTGLVPFLTRCCREGAAEIPLATLLASPAAIDLTGAVFPPPAHAFRPIAGWLEEG
ncbi:hypothetical protein CKO11_14820 [Rhodobacter sp. TJ_12]|uniref:amino acid adenylation domain-containing protein n=1 Tax=Rhodobacter sp. TJ_12 TaxID=2029399 RepID=UPI001CC0DBE8|nr:amino acid adenylation domain-containing protein [Rhodobacter sp. TJ_12]MBZ4023724.1 hypothetical protein [Rhodobacter sp. TJ_12]